MFKKIHQSTGHRAALYTVTQSHTPRCLLAAGGDGWISEWQLDDPETGRVIANTPTPIYALEISPPHWPEQLLLIGDMLGHFYWIDRAHPEAGRNVQHHSKGIYAIQWQLAEEEVFTAGGDGILTRWNPSEKRPVESIHLSNRPLRCMASNPRQDLLAVGASDGYIYYLRRSSFELLERVNAHQFSVFSLLWSPDGTVLYSGGRDALLKSWRDFNVNEISIPAHLGTINHLVLSPNGQWIASAGKDKNIKIWAAADLRLLKVLDTIREQGHFNSVNRLIWDENGLFSVSDDRSIIFWGAEK